MALAAALAVLDVFEDEGLVERAAEIGETMRTRMLGWQERFEAIGDVRGLGAMLALELVSDRGTKAPAPELAAAVIDEALSRGLLLLKAGVYGNCIRALCPLTISDAELAEALDVWEQALQAASRRAILALSCWARTPRRKRSRVCRSSRAAPSASWP